MAVGELQKRGMTVVMGPHGSFVNRGQDMKPPGSNLDLSIPTLLDASDKRRVLWALVDLRDAVPTSKTPE